MVKRYDAWLAYDASGAYVAMDDADDGCFVTYDDYAALQAENERLMVLIDGQARDNGVRVDRGALRMAINVLRRSGKDEVADALEDGVIDAHKGE